MVSVFTVQLIQNKGKQGIRQNTQSLQRAHYWKHFYKLKTCAMGTTWTQQPVNTHTCICRGMWKGASKLPATFFLDYTYSISIVLHLESRSAIYIWAKVTKSGRSASVRQMEIQSQNPRSITKVTSQGGGEQIPFPFPIGTEFSRGEACLATVTTRILLPLCQTEIILNHILLQVLTNDPV